MEQGVAGITEAIIGNQVASITGTTLIDFLESRRQDGGLATLIIDFPAGASDKSLYYASKENGSLAAPTLTLEAIPRNVPLDC